MLWIPVMGNSVRRLKRFGLRLDLINRTPQNSRPRKARSTPRSPSLYGVNLSRMFPPRSYDKFKRSKIDPLSSVSKYLSTVKILFPRFVEVLLKHQIRIPSLKDNWSLVMWNSFEKWLVLHNSNLLKISLNLHDLWYKAPILDITDRRL